MDRSFLSNEKVVAASRDFVCVRLATYEDAEEAEFLKKVYVRRGDLENTVFAMLAPDGKTHLTRSGRKPSFRGASQMARGMDEMIDREYRSAQTKRWTDSTLPEMKGLDLAINVASCDRLPVVVAVGKSESELTEFRKRLVPIAWSDQFAGQFVYATVKSDSDLRPISSLNEEQPEGIYVLEPDTFGMSGKVLTKLGLDSNADRQQLAKVLSQFKPPVKDHRQHVQTGYQLGLRWETAVPVTDKQAVQAASRLWGRD